MGSHSTASVIARLPGQDRRSARRMEYPTGCRATTVPCKTAGSTKSIERPCTITLRQPGQEERDPVAFTQKCHAVTPQGHVAQAGKVNKDGSNCLRMVGNRQLAPTCLPRRESIHTRGDDKTRRRLHGAHSFHQGAQRRRAVRAPRCYPVGGGIIGDRRLMDRLCHTSTLPFLRGPRVGPAPPVPPVRPVHPPPLDRRGVPDRRAASRC